METQHKPAPSFFQRTFKKTWVRVCSTLILLFVVFLLVLPLVVRIGLEHWLLNNGADQATISKVQINLFTGSASISGLDVTLGGETVLSDSNISLNLGLGALFSREAFIQRASLQNVILDIKLSEDGGWRIGSISIPPNDIAAETQELEKNAEDHWFFRTQQLEMVDCVIRYAQPELEVTLQVEHGLLSQFSTDPSDTSGTFTFKGKLNNAPLDLKIDTLRIAPEIEIRGRINTSNLQLNDLADLLREYINPFSGLAGAQGAINFTLAQDNSILVDYKGSIDLNKANIGGPAYTISGANLTWNGPVNYRQDKNNKISIDLDGSLKGSELDLKLPDLTLRLTEESFEITGKTTVNIDQQVTVHNEGTINLGTTDFAIAPYQVQNKNLTMTGNITLPLDDPLTLKGNASLQTEGLLLTDTTRDKPLVSLDQLTVEDIDAPGDTTLVTNGVKIEKLALHSPADNALTLTIAELMVNQFQAENMQKFSVQNITVQGVLADNSEKKKQIASIDSITLTDIRADDSLNVDAESLQVNNARIFEQTRDGEKTNLLQLAGLTVNKPAWRDKGGLNIADINLKDLDVKLIKDQNGKFLFTRDLQELKSAPSGEQVAPEEETGGKVKPSPFTLQIGEISTTGKSELRYEDHALKFPYILTVTLESFHITNLNSDQPDQAASYELIGKLDQYSPLTINGSFKPFGEDFSLQQTLSLQNYPMAQLAPYGLQYLGIVPTQGTLSVDTTLSIEKGSIDLQKDWLIKKLEIKTVEEELAKEFNSQLPLSINAALAMLKDKHDNIELSIPISGPVDDLDFGITSLFITPLSKAIVNTSSSYLLYTLGPYGAAAYIGLKVGKKLMEVRVPPVIFEPGKKELTEEHKKYLERIAEVLNNRPKIDLQLCAFVLPTEHLIRSTKNEHDEQPPGSDNIENKKDTTLPPTELSTEDKKAMLKLGNSRALTIEDYLVREHDINPGRLIICLPELDENKDAEPRVELEV